MATEKFANDASSTLSGDIGAADTSLSVVSASAFPTDGQFRVRVDSEIMLVTAVSGTTFTVTRGQENTTAATHSSGATLSQVLTAGALTKFQADTLAAISSTNTPRRVPIDVDTVISWTFNGSNPYLNYGFGSAATLSAQPGVTVNQRTGLFGQALNISSVTSTGCLATADTSVGESNSCTISVWVYLRSYRAGSYGTIVLKNYHLDSATWGLSGLYYTMGFLMLNSGTGSWSSQVIVNATNNVLNVTASSDCIPLNQWTLLTETFDATTGVQKLYKNGSLVASATYTATSLDWGSHGPWYVGGNPKAPSDYLDGMVADIRIESVVRDQDYLENMYRRGIGLFDNYDGATPTRVITNVVTNYTIIASDDLISVGTLTSAPTLTLPTTPIMGESHEVKDANGTCNSYNITVSGGGYNIDGATTFVLSASYDCYQFTFNGTKWLVS